MSLLSSSSFLAHSTIDDHYSLLPPPSLPLFPLLGVHYGDPHLRRRQQSAHHRHRLRNQTEHHQELRVQTGISSVTEDDIVSCYASAMNLLLLSP